MPLCVDGMDRSRASCPGASPRNPSRPSSHSPRAFHVDPQLSSTPHAYPLHSPRPPSPVPSPSTRSSPCKDGMDRRRAINPTTFPLPGSCVDGTDRCRASNTFALSGCSPVSPSTCSNPPSMLTVCIVSGQLPLLLKPSYVAPARSQRRRHRTRAYERDARALL